MELPRHLLLGGEVAIYDAERLGTGRGAAITALGAAIDAMGVLSARAQALGVPISTAQKLQANPGQRLYVMFDEAAHAAVGILKVGTKHLFITESTKQHEIEPLCVLDFYVHESRQRSGCGKRLFKEMLCAERIEPHRLGYDRPSPKLLGFLRKHYSLSRFTPQANNFVVFVDFFAGSGPRAQSSSRRGHQAAPLVPAASAASHQPRQPQRQQPGQRQAVPEAQQRQQQAVPEVQHQKQQRGRSRGGSPGEPQTPDAHAWAHAFVGGGGGGGGGPNGAAARMSTPPSQGRRSRTGGTTVVTAPGMRGGSARATALEPEPEPQQWSPGPVTAGDRAATTSVDERTRQLREAAVLSLTKAAANCATASELDARELGVSSNDEFCIKNEELCI